MLSYMTMLELKQIIQGMDHRSATKPLHIFSRICKIVKCFAQAKGIYYFKLGYLNGISIMVMVAYVLG